MKDKRILICCNRTLNLGGIEKALTTFLKAFNTKENDVTLVLYDDNGVLHSELPLDHIRVFYVNSIDASAMLREDIRKFQLGQVCKGLWNRLMLRLDQDWYARIMYTYRILERKLVFPGHFDCAISFTTDYSDLSMVAAADADKRVCFVHGDATKGPRSARLNDHLVRKMDKVYAVSQQAKELFVQMHPACEETSDVIHNVILAEDILKKAEEPVDDMICDGVLTLCTVGRLSPEKGQQMIPEIAEHLRGAGWKFRWYLVGDGSLRSELEQKIGELGLQDQVILLGGKQNPYPYMKKCDIYVQTSFSEAYCSTTAEAKVLCKPVVSTDAPGMREQFSSGEDGLIVDQMTPGALFEGIQLLLENPELRRKFSQELSGRANQGLNEIQKLYNFIEG